MCSTRWNRVGNSNGFVLRIAATRIMVSSSSSAVDRPWRILTIMNSSTGQHTVSLSPFRLMIQTATQPLTRLEFWARYSPVLKRCWLINHIFSFKICAASQTLLFSSWRAFSFPSQTRRDCVDLYHCIYCSQKAFKPARFVFISAAVLCGVTVSLR